MKVWIVTFGEYEEACTIFGVFSSLELAEAFVKKTGFGSPHIEEHVVDDTSSLFPVETDASL